MLNRFVGSALLNSLFIVAVLSQDNLPREKKLPPLDVVIIIDESNSMTSQEKPYKKLEKFVEDMFEISPSHTHIAIVKDCPNAVTFSADKKKVMDSIKAARAAGIAYHKDISANSSVVASQKPREHVFSCLKSVSEMFFRKIDRSNVPNVFFYFGDGIHDRGPFHHYAQKIKESARRYYLLLPIMVNHTNETAFAKDYVPIIRKIVGDDDNVFKIDEMGLDEIKRKVMKDLNSSAGGDVTSTGASASGNDSDSRSTGGVNHRKENKPSVQEDDQTKRSSLIAFVIGGILLLLLILLVILIVVLLRRRRSKKAVLKKGKKPLGMGLSEQERREHARGTNVDLNLEKGKKPLGMGLSEQERREHARGMYVDLNLEKGKKPLGIGLSEQERREHARGMYVDLNLEKGKKPLGMGLSEQEKHERARGMNVDLDPQSRLSKHGKSVKKGKIPKSSIVEKGDAKNAAARSKNIAKQSKNTMEQLKVASNVSPSKGKKGHSH